MVRRWQKNIYGVKNMGIKTLTYNETQYPEVVRIANELGRLEQRRPHDSLRLLIEQLGQKKIDELKSRE
jgi:hypothetical protein